MAVESGHGNDLLDAGCTSQAPQETHLRFPMRSTITMAYKEQASLTSLPGNCSQRFGLGQILPLST